MAAPQHWSHRKASATLVIPQAEDTACDRVIAGRGDQPSLLRGAELLEATDDLELAFGAAEANIGRLAIEFASTAKWRGQEPDSVDRVTFAAVILAN